ncbi:gastrula zinc finger protein XlCGF57.1 isoform X2 [Toxorhynchites rutilus septentrionalis]|uniref:gastrula zinc finger protein XlCGF57.1 isoform X2 n=1 Tax=Toxorhynchites rutilus septentrionalis TaxID=329112 RepID=UPI00247A92E1|nr:gastrula zinc finger protein XlCGF57.1 isoform X2 [Toxorhynchites rutilus septentrionalis]
MAVLNFASETGANKCAYMDIDAIYFQLLLLLKQGITKGMMPNFYDHSRPTMVPTSSAAMLGASTNSGEQSQKKTQIAPFDLEATLQAVDNEVLEGEEGSCPLCNKTFSRKSSLLNHIRNHTAEKKYICEYCQKGFSQQANLRNHVRIHTNERPYVCVDCGKAFTQITNLNNHRRLHTGERPYVCIEANCGRSFAQVTNLNNHMKTHHKTQQYVCNQCPRRFYQVTQLNLHLISEHSTTKTFFCPQCPEKRFKSQSLFQHHLKIHGSNFGFPCSKCDERFIQESHLILHMTHQHGDYACNMCSMTFNDEVLLKKHVQRHLDGRFLTCPVLGCNEGFTMKNQLTKHMQMRHPAIDLKKGPLSAGTAVRPPKHCCHYFNCNESFDSSEGLSNHLRVTHGLPIAAPEDKKPMPQQMIGNGGGDIHMTQIHTPPPLLGASFQSYQQQITEAQQHAGSTAEKQKAYSVSDLLNISEEMQQHHHQQQQQRVGQQNGKPDLEQILEDRVNNLSRIKTELQANMQIQNLFGLSSPMGLNPFASPTKLVCSFCYNVYKTPQTLSRHIEKFHS